MYGGTGRKHRHEDARGGRCLNIITSQLVNGPGSKSCSKISCPDGIGHGGFYYETDEGAFCGSWSGDDPAKQTTYCKGTPTKDGPAGKKDTTCTKAMIDHPDELDAGMVMIGLKRMACTHNSEGVQDCKVFKTGKCLLFKDRQFNRGDLPRAGTWVNPLSNRAQVRNLAIPAAIFHAEKKAVGAKLVALLKRYNNDLSQVEADPAVTPCLYPAHRGVSDPRYSAEKAHIVTNADDATRLLMLL